MECICINSKNKPNDIQNKNWIKKGNKYTIVVLKKSVITNEMFLVLEEVQPDPPYGGYKIERFGFDMETLLKLFKVENIEEPELV